jgi:hypothetical protein
MSGWIKEGPPTSAASDAYLFSNTSVATEAILVAAYMAAERQLTTRHDLAIAVRIELDIVQ